MKGAQILLVRKDGALLLMQRDDKPGIINPGVISSFGGNVEEGEDPLTAAHREINEETNLGLNKDDLIFFKQYRKTKAEHGEDRDVYYFIARDIDDSNLETYEGQGYVVVKNLKEALKQNLSILMRQVAKDFFTQNPPQA